MDWDKYISKPDVVLNGKTPDGTRLVLLFAEDYKKKMGKDLDISCPKCFRSDFNKFINSNYTIMSKTESGFEVKKKYDGLAHPCSKNILSNKAIAKNPDVAVEFYAEHPNGKSLFVTVPKGIEKMVEDYQATKAKAEAEAAEAAKKAEAEKKTAEEMKQALADAEQYGVDVNKADGNPKALSTLQKHISEAKKKAEEAAKEKAKATEESDKNHDALAHKQPDSEDAEKSDEEE